MAIGHETARQRRLIRAAAKHNYVKVNDDLEAFIRLMKTFVSDDDNLHDIRAIVRLYEICSSRGQVTIMSVVNDAGHGTASVIVVWGFDTLYYWMPIRNKSNTGSGENSLLIWESIKFALNRKLSFDFDGYASSDSAKFLLKFGVPPVARSKIIYTNAVGSMVEAARNLMSDNLHFRLWRTASGSGRCRGTLSDGCSNNGTNAR